MDKLVDRVRKTLLARAKTIRALGRTFRILNS